MKSLMIGTLGLSLFLAAQSHADVTNAITAPIDGAVYTSPTEPYTIPVAGIANATGSNNLEIIIALDYSGSVGTTNWNLEIQGAERVIQNLRDPNNPAQLLAPVALIGFGTTATTRLAPPSTSYASLMSSLSTWPYAGGNTAIGDGLNLANAIFGANGHTQDEILFFFSDGVPNVGADWVTASNNLHNNGVLVNAYGITSGVNTTIMRTIADETNSAVDGHYYYAPTFAAVVAAVDASMPSTGGVSLDSVTVFVNGTRTGQAVVGVGGTYSSSADLLYGLNDITTIAYATDGSTSTDNVSVTLNAPVEAVPEPGTMALMGLGMAGLVFGVRRRK
jgi:hypothetical protein